MLGWFFFWISGKKKVPCRTNHKFTHFPPGSLTDPSSCSCLVVNCGEIWGQEEARQEREKGKIKQRSRGSQYDTWLSSLPLSKQDTSLIPTPPTPHCNLHLRWPRLARTQACNPVRDLGPVQAPSRCKHQNSHRLSPSHGPSATSWDKSSDILLCAWCVLMCLFQRNSVKNETTALVYLIQVFRTITNNNLKCPNVKLEKCSVVKQRCHHVFLIIRWHSLANAM